MAPASRKELLHIQENYVVWIHSETRRCHDNNIWSFVDIALLDDGLNQIIFLDLILVFAIDF